jgi:hypothetical protein
MLLPITWFWAKHRRCEGFAGMEENDMYGYWCPVHDTGRGLYLATRMSDLGRRIYSGEITPAEAQQEIMERLVDVHSQRKMEIQYGSSIHQRIQNYYKNMKDE